MAKRDQKLLGLLFEPGGAIDQFYKNPNLSFIGIRGVYVAKKPILRLLRFLLPQYRVFKDDDKLINQLYLYKSRDLNIRRMMTQDELVLSNQTHNEFDQINKLPESQQQPAQQSWVDRIEKPPPPSLIKDLSSQGQILTKRVGSAAARGIGGMLKGVGGLGRQLGKMALQALIRGLAGLVTSIGGSAALPIIAAIVIVILLIIILPILTNLLETASLIPPFQQTTEGVPGTPPAGEIGISGCPVPGIITTPYGFNIAGYPNVPNVGCGSLPNCHSGVDIAAPDGTPIKSPVTGRIIFIGQDSLRGKYIEIKNDSTGITVTLEHLQNYTPLLTINSDVNQGSVVGTVGRSGETTGSTLHYRINKGAVILNPLHYFGLSANLDPSTLTTSDNISENDYRGRVPTSGNIDNWGRCTSSP